MSEPRPSIEYGLPVLDVAPESWEPAARAARDERELTYFDWLSAVDEGEDGLSVVVHLWSPRRHEHLLLRTRLPRSRPRLASLCGLFAGANWHERETREMFGVEFAGHPDPRPLLLAPDAPATPLRKGERT